MKAVVEVRNAPEAIRFLQKRGTYQIKDNYELVLSQKPTPEGMLYRLFVDAMEYGLYGVKVPNRIDTYGIFIPHDDTTTNPYWALLEGCPTIEITQGG